MLITLLWRNPSKFNILGLNMILLFFVFNLFVFFLFSNVFWVKNLNSPDSHY